MKPDEEAEPATDEEDNSHLVGLAVLIGYGAVLAKMAYDNFSKLSPAPAPSLKPAPTPPPSDGTLVIPSSADLAQTMNELTQKKNPDS